MSHVKIQTEHAPAAIGPYSQAVQAGGTVYVSGQLPINGYRRVCGRGYPRTGAPVAGEYQAILAAAGMGMPNVVKTTVLLQDMADFAAMNEVYAEYFTEPYPARAAFQVAKLPKGALVEIEAVAVQP